MKTIIEAWRSATTLTAAVVLATGCAVTPLTGEDGVAGDGPVTLRSPAGERVVSGIVEMVLTDRAFATFEEARDNPVAQVQDGTPLFAYIRANRPLGDLAHPSDPSGSYTFSDYPHLFLQVGDTDSLRTLGTCYITLTGEETRLREVVVPLAPLTYRPGQIPADCWLATVVSGRSGKRTYEVRLAGFAGKFESWLPVPDLLAVKAVETDLSSGAGEYATMLRATPLRNATLLASTSTLQTASVNPVALSAVNPVAVATPVRGSSLVAASSAPLPGPRQDIGNSRIELQLQSLSAALLGRRPSETYFVDGQWSSTTDPRGRPTQQHAYAAAVFKGATCTWLRLKAFRRPGASSLLDVEQAGEPVEIDCSNLR